tara:strand:+ start:4125 stop:4481 length:357 start_codon:yes stop_codon:yes gene_type:complete
MTEKQSDLFETIFSSKKRGAIRDPELLLWQSVLITAINDADNLDSKSRVRRRNAVDAIVWMSENSEDFATVCDLARENPDYASMRFKQWLANRYPATLLANVFASHAEGGAKPKKRRL